MSAVRLVFLTRSPRVALAMLCAVLLLSSTASAQTTSTPDPAVLRAIEAQVVELRGLPALAQPPLRVMDRAGLHAYLADALDRDYLPIERETDQKHLVALGLLAPTDDLVQIELRLLSDQVIGMYRPDTRAMLVVGDRFGPAERLTYAHEYDHALQDQHYGLDALAPKHSQNNDRSLAAHALIEGEAVLLQTLWAQAHLSASEFVELARAGNQGSASLESAPPVVRTELLFPYVDGLNFVRRAYRNAGNSYAGLEQVFLNPPESTAQILHPDKYFGGIHPIDVDLPDIAAALGGRWRHVGSGVLGELDTRVLLEQHLDRAEAAGLAAGWSGDRWELIENQGRTLLVSRWSWETSDAAQRFADAYRSALGMRSDWATALWVDGQDVVAVVAPDADAASAVQALLRPSGRESASALD